MIRPDELPVRDGYAAWAPWYDTDGNPLTALEEPVMLGWFGELRGRDALDLGCGTGRLTVPLARGGARVTGLDFTPEMMQEARRKLHNVDVRWVEHALPEPLPFEGQSFDLVVMGLVIEHIEDLDALLCEVARVLRPGGRCLVSALHPDRTAEGQRARYIDPDTGERRHIATIHRDVSDYHASARNAGLSLVEDRTLRVTEALAERLPRARRYLDLPLGWAAYLECGGLLPLSGRGACSP